MGTRTISQRREAMTEALPATSSLPPESPAMGDVHRRGLPAANHLSLIQRTASPQSSRNSTWQSGRTASRARASRRACRKSSAKRTTRSPSPCNSLGTGLGPERTVGSLTLAMYPATRDLHLGEVGVGCARGGSLALPRRRSAASPPPHTHPFRFPEVPAAAGADP